MGPLTSTERGTVIADRYVISEVLRPWLPEHPEAGQVNLGLDAILDTPVIVYTAREDTAAGLFSTANRAALLTDPRIPAIVNVGLQDDMVYVVCERTGGTPLSKMLAGGPISVDAATAVVGELATALTHADRRGLHHLMLGPESVAVTPDGEVIVRGVGIDAAVADTVEDLELDMLTSSRAARRDSLDIINIFYAALTGRWPDDEGRAGLPAAGRRNRRITSAGTFNQDIPDELEVFISGVVGGTDPGPRSPSEIVRYLGEWDTKHLTELPQLSRTEDELFAESSGPVAEPVEDEPDDGGASEAQLANAWARIGLVRPGVSGAAAGVSGSGATPYDDRMRMAKATRFPLSADQLSSTREWSPEDTAASTASAHDPNLTAPIMRRGDEADDAADDSQPNTQAMPVVPEPDNAGEAADDSDGSWFLGGMFQTREQEYERQRAEYDHERRLQERARRRAEEAAAAQAASQSASQPDASSHAPSSDEAEPAPAADSSPASGGESPQKDAPAPTIKSAVPAAGTAAAQPRPQQQAPAKASGASSEKVPAGTDSGSAAVDPEPQKPKKKRGLLTGAIVVMALGVVVLIVALIGLLGGGDDNTAEVGTPSEQSQSSEQPTKTEEPKEPVKVSISKAKALDPQGDGKENNAQAKSVLKKEGQWTSDRYNSKEFGGLKDGLGLQLTLESEAELSRVVVDSKAKGGSFEIRVGDDPEDATVIGTGEFGKKVEVELDKPEKTKSFYLWITELPTYSDSPRAAISRITAYAQED